MAIIDLGNTAASSLELKKAPKTMLKHYKDSGKDVVEINVSSLSILQSCMRKALYSLHNKLVSKKESPATLFGSAIHKALEVFYSSSIEERVLPTNFDKTMDTLCSGAVNPDEGFLVYRAAKAFIDSATALAALPEDNKRSVANGLWTLKHYFKSYIDDPYHVYCDEAGPLTECTLSKTIYDDDHLTVILFGTVDVILQHSRTNEIIVCDHKTSSVVGPDFYNRLKPNHQYTAYTYLAQSVLGLETDKFLVNCLQVKVKPKTNRGTPPNFPRQITTRSSEDIEDFKRTVVYWARRYLEAINDNFWPMGDVNNCTMYGGCQYLDVCSSPNSIKQNILDVNFMEREDEPNE